MTDVLEPYGKLLDTSVRVASWNVWARFGPWRQREALLLKALEQAQPDIVCLQESWKADDKTQAERFGAKLGMHSCHHGSVDPHEGVVSGQAVLSRWPIVATESLSVGDEETGSGATFAQVDGPRGPINIISLILTWRIDHSDIRSAHLQEILSWARELSDRFHPLIVCGDFNAVAQADELRAMVGLSPVHVKNMVFYDAVTMCASGDPATYDTRNPFAAIGLYPDKRLDHIFSHWPKAHGAGHPIDAGIFGDEPDSDGTFPSDHFGVWADLRY